MGGAQAVCSIAAFGVAEAATNTLAFSALFVVAALSLGLLAMALKMPTPPARGRGDRNRGLRPR